MIVEEALHMASMTLPSEHVSTPVESGLRMVEEDFRRAIAQPGRRLCDGNANILRRRRADHLVTAVAGMSIMIL